MLSKLNMPQKVKKFLTPTNVLLITVFLILFFSLRWNSFTAPFERDEGEYAYSAWIMRKGIMPYENSFPYKPPMIIYTFLVSQIIFGDYTWPPRVLAVIFSLLTIFFVALIVKRQYGTTPAWISAFLLSIMLLLPTGFGSPILADIYYAANTEIFMILPLTVLLYLYVKYKECAGNLTWFISGILTALALNYKPICLPILAVIYVFWLINVWKYQKNLGSIVIKSTFVFLGVALTSLVIYLPFLISDGGRAIWDELVNFTACYSKQSAWNFELGNLINRLVMLGKYYWVLYLITAYYLFKRPKDWQLFSLLFLISVLSIYQSVIGHYFIQIMPFWAIISAGAISELIKTNIMKKKTVLLIAVILVSITWPIKQIFSKTPQELGLWVYGPYDPYYEAEVVGKKIQAITKPNDFVFVQGDDAEITYFAQRRSSLRIESTGFFAYTCEMLNKYKKQAVDDLKSHPPEAIVICATGSCNYVWQDKNARPFMELLTKMINENYLLVGGWIPDNKGGYWQEPMKPSDIPLARSILFKRK